MDNLINQLQDLWLLFSYPIVKLGEADISFVSILTAIIIFIISLKAGRIVEKLVQKFLKDKPIDPGVKGSLERVTRYLAIVTGTVIALDTVGLNLSSLAALGAVLMVGIGFGLQNITQNFISGLIILLERPVKTGDLVKVGGTTGRVIDIRARSTIIQTRDDVSILVPNSQFIAEQVVNESFSGKKIRLHICVGVAYGSDVEKVQETLIRIANKHTQILKNPPATVVFKDFGNSSLDFDLRVWTRELWKSDVLTSDIRFAIDKEFRKKKIEIPFPQRDLHIRSTVEKS